MRQDTPLDYLIKKYKCSRRRFLGYTIKLRCFRYHGYIEGKNIIYTVIPPGHRGASQHNSMPVPSPDKWRDKPETQPNIPLKRGFYLLPFSSSYFYFSDLHLDSCLLGHSHQKNCYVEPRFLLES